VIISKIAEGKWASKMSGSQTNNVIKPMRSVLPVVILLAGVIMMVLGVWRGELHDIFRKATILCLECIGIG